MRDQSLRVEVASPNELVTYMKTGDLLASKMQTLVNTVNCVGVMGKGIAFAFKQRYPDMFEDYKTRCAKKQVKLGEPYLYRISENRYIVNFPTKAHWKNNSQLHDIERGLQYLAKHIREWGITSMAIPPLGCGNGRLNWEEVRPLINKYLIPLRIPLEIYEPFQNPTIKKRKTSDTNNPQPQKSLISFFQPAPIAPDSDNQPTALKRTKLSEEEKCGI